MNIPPSHPRAESLGVRETLSKAFEEGVVVREGLVAHGRGEAFDYLLGEETIPQAKEAIRSAIARMLTAKSQVISVNGNVAALDPKGIVELARATDSKLEVNLFYRSEARVGKIAKILSDLGVEEVLGADADYRVRIPELGSERRWVDSRGIMAADVVLVPLEDGDRTESLVRMGKDVIAIDLNPLSRTSQMASITVVDNLIRAIPEMLDHARTLKGLSEERLRVMAESFDNRRNLASIVRYLSARLMEIADGRRE